MTYCLHYAPDNASLVIRLALEELALAYDVRLVDRGSAQQKSEAYRALNPAGRIPVLETPDGPVFETAAILIWLSDRYGGLLPPAGAAERGTALKWLLYIASTLHPHLIQLFYSDRYSGHVDDFRSHVAALARHDLLLLDSALDGAMPFFGGAAPDARDLYLGPLLRWAALFPRGQTGWFDLSATPRLFAMAEALERRPSARAAAEAEGLGPTPFTAPQPACPPEGSAT